MSLLGWGVVLKALAEKGINVKNEKHEKTEHNEIHEEIHETINITINSPGNVIIIDDLGRRRRRRLY